MHALGGPTPPEQYGGHFDASFQWTAVTSAASTRIISGAGKHLWGFLQCLMGVKFYFFAEMWREPSVSLWDLQL